MSGYTHEVRDPIHGFIRFDDDERAVINSRPVQRLRHIYQLALSYLIYPGATHRRFEHALGVMELAGRVFDVVTRDENLTDDTRRLLPQIEDRDIRAHWRRHLRMAALCHDIGHLPFSHGAEDLLPPRVTHETLTRRLIESPEMAGIWGARQAPLDSDLIIKLSLGKEKAPDLSFTSAEEILSEIIVGDSFGVDRMDYLLRDSHHVGVPDGRFDHFRLIDTLRILPSYGGLTAPELGVAEGGLRSAEALLWARYLIYSSVYFHPVRRAYNIHLKEFLQGWLPGGQFSTDLDVHLKLTDNEVMTAILDRSDQPGSPAYRIVHRDHLRELYRRHLPDVKRDLEIARKVYDRAVAMFGAEHLRYDEEPPRGGLPDFPVLTKSRGVVRSLDLMEAIGGIPDFDLAVNFVFVDRSLRDQARTWLDSELPQLLGRVNE